MPQTKLHKFTVNYSSQMEFHQLKNEIFNEKIYFFETDSPSPVILDVGAHIGLATLYFKHLYPFAKIIAIEPNPISFQLLEQNIWENNLTEVIAHNLAIASQKNQLNLHQDPDLEWLSSTSIHQGAWNGEQKTESFSVRAVPLTQFLDQKIDLLKMDVEGSETEIILSVDEKLQQIQQMIIECHGQDFSTTAKIQKHLQDLGFEISFFKKNKIINIQQARGLFFIHGLNSN